MSPEEITAWVTALYWRRKYDDVSPEVGMGPTWVMLLEDILPDDVLISDDDLLAVVTAANERYGGV